MTFTQFDFEQMQINATHGHDCMGKLRKVENGKGNFDIYYDTKSKCFRSVAKPGSGCTSSYYGGTHHIMNALRNGWMDAHGLTKFGRRLIGKI